MNFLPISINVLNEQILIVGGGKLAHSKVLLLKRFTHSFKIIAPAIVDDLKQLDGVVCVERQYRATDLDGHLLVFLHYQGAGSACAALGIGRCPVIFSGIRLGGACHPAGMPCRSPRRANHSGVASP